MQYDNAYYDSGTGEAELNEMMNAKARDGWEIVTITFEITRYRIFWKKPA